MGGLRDLEKEIQNEKKNQEMEVEKNEMVLKQWRKSSCKIWRGIVEENMKHQNG